MQECPRSQQKRGQWYICSGHVHGCRSDLSLTWFWRAGTDAGQEGGHQQSWRALGFAHSSQVCTSYGIKLDFPTTKGINFVD